MQTIIFSSDMDIINEWVKRYNISNFTSCYDTATLETQLTKYKSYILLCDFDTISHDLNVLISTNKLPKNCMVLEKFPAITTGKQLIFQGIKAYGNSRMLPHHYMQMVQTVIDKDTWTYPKLTLALVKSTNKIDLNSDAKKLIEDRLTQKEYEVTYLVLEGLSNDAIAKKLKVTIRTIKAHITSIFSKLHVNDRMSLVLLLK